MRRIEATLGRRIKVSTPPKVEEITFDLVFSKVPGRKESIPGT
jgi:hypothetical protein